MTPPFLVVGFESSVPCFLLIVYQMDKVELRHSFPPDSVRRIMLDSLGEETIKG